MKGFFAFTSLLISFLGTSSASQGLIHLSNNSSYFSAYNITERNITHNYIEAKDTNFDNLAKKLFKEINRVCIRNFSNEDHYTNTCNLKDIENFLYDMQAQTKDCRINSISLDLMTIRKIEGLFFITKAIISDVRVDNQYPPVKGYFYFSDFALNDSIDDSPFDYRHIY